MLNHKIGAKFHAHVHLSNNGEYKRCGSRFVASRNHFAPEKSNALLIHRFLQLRNRRSLRRLCMCFLDQHRWLLLRSVLEHKAQFYSLNSEMSLGSQMFFQQSIV